ncbi:MAG: thioredoxin-dependent thiol peroxidase [Dehalococcoidia bacterium]|nr:thioredoxin-dependent thiol peroxidase [Dehalococcoidia bacterium]
MPQPGAQAPVFRLKDQAGEAHELRDYRGKWVVLYFYPRDNTPGCTKEACSFRDNYGPIQAAGAVVLGVSADSAASHQKFAEKYDLPFTLLIDDDNHAAARAYGAYGMKRQYGREYEGVIRSTFIIDPAGHIAKTWTKVNTSTHGADVLAWLQANAR